MDLACEIKSEFDRLCILKRPNNINAGDTVNPSIIDHKLIHIKLFDQLLDF